MVLSEPNIKFLPTDLQCAKLNKLGCCLPLIAIAFGLAQTAWHRRHSAAPQQRIGFSSHGYWPLLPIMVFQCIVLRGPMTDSAAVFAYLKLAGIAALLRSFSTTQPRHTNFQIRYFWPEQNVHVSCCKQSATDECNAPLGALAMSPYLMGMVIRGWW